MKTTQLYNVWRTNSIFKYLKKNYILDSKIDHIAYRSFEKKKKVNYLKSEGYKEQKDKYNFKRHNASAIWLKHDREIIPRIFISGYNSIYDDKNILASNLDIEKIVYYINNEEAKISYKFYNEIYEKNQYLAWTLIFRDNIMNHIAFNVKDIKCLYKKLKKDEIIEISNNIQISEDKKLLQFSTKSEKNLVKFPDGKYYIPTYFFEFVERLDNREGFSEKNADIIFDSTN